jgi:hypothetical protein
VVAADPAAANEDLAVLAKRIRHRWEGTQRAIGRKITPLPMHVQIFSSSDMVHLKSATPEVRLHLYEGAGLEVQVMPLGTFARAHEPPMRNKDTISTQ